MSFQKIPDEEYQKLTTGLKWQIGKALGVFNCYGLGDYIPEVTSVIVGLAEKYAMAIRGKDAKIETGYARKRPTE